MGYFQCLWFFIWNNLIKNSRTYKILHGVYEFFSSMWKSSAITDFFRKKDSDSDAEGGLGRVFGGIFRHLNALGEKNEFFNRLNERSGVVSACKYLLHNFLAVNLRFIGILFAVDFGLFSVLSLFSGEFRKTYWLLTVFFALIAFLNVNVVDYIKDSFLSRFAENLLGTKLSYRFYYMTKCSKSKKRYVCAVIFGVLIGVVSFLTKPAFGVLAVLGILFVCAVMYKAELGVFLTAFLAPFVPTMVLAGLIALCLVSLVVRGLSTKNFKWRFGIVGMFIMLLLFIYFVAAIFSFARGNSIRIWFVFAAMTAFFFAVINTVKTRKQFMDLCRVFALSAVFVCLYGLYQYVFRPGGAEAWLDDEMFSGISMRIYSTLENPNVLGEYLVLAIPICVGLMWTSEKFLAKLFYALSAVLMTGVLVLTFSRGCWIALVIAAAIYVTFVCGKLWGLLLLALPVIPFVIPETVLQRLTSIGDMNDSSTSYRVYIWMGTLQMLKDFWLFGIGLGEEAFNSVYPFYAYSAVVAPHSHNLFLQIWVETGLAGIITFIIILLAWLRQAGFGHTAAKEKTKKTMIVAIAAGVIGFLAQGMFDNCFYNYRVVMVFWFVLALGTAAVNIAKEESE